MLWAHRSSIAIGLVTCLVVLVAVELAVFRSGLFLSHVGFASPVSPIAKLALAERAPDARLLFVGDSTVLADVAPAVVTQTCDCGEGFNGAFAAANARTTLAMTRRLLGILHPRLVVVDAAPWLVDTSGQFTGDLFAREVLSPADLYALGEPVDAVGMVDKEVGSVWTAYGQRFLVKEWLQSLVPGQRYDEAKRGLYVPPGSATSPAALAAAMEHYFPDPTAQVAPSAPGATALGALIEELRGRGISVAVLLPPFHPAVREHAGPFLDRADAAIQQFLSGYGVSVIDCRGAVAATDFRDLAHLTEQGAAKHSLCVGEQIRTLDAASALQ